MKRVLYYLGLVLLLSGLLLVSCYEKRSTDKERENNWAEKRATMVHQLRVYGIEDERILKAMNSIQRHKFIPERYLDIAAPYGDHPCPIGHGQTISQPYIVAYMTEKLHIQPGGKILEIGTGSGYQAAVLAELGAEVYSIEIVPELADHARKALSEQGYEEVNVLTGNGYEGWLEYSPFDDIIVTCAPEHIPQALVNQLREGGRMILPLGVGVQRLVILRKISGRIEKVDDLPVRFVPMVRRP